MKMNFRMLLMGLAVVAFVYGCGKKADTNKPVEQIKQEVQAMSLSDLESNAKAYAKEVEAKKPELEKIAAEMKTLSPTEIFSDKAKEIKSRLSSVQGEISALMERYQVYAQKYQETGGDVSKIKVA